jgi:hypothetical protein
MYFRTDMTGKAGNFDRLSPNPLSKFLPISLSISRFNLPMNSPQLLMLSFYRFESRNPGIVTFLVSARTSY